MSDAPAPAGTPVPRHARPVIDHQEARRTQFVLASMVAYLVLNVILGATRGGWLPLTLGIAAILGAYLWFWRH